MVVDELSLSPQYRLGKMLKLLEGLYGITISFDKVKDLHQLSSLYEECDLDKANIIRESEHNTCLQNPLYAKACLIQESVKIYLNEIAILSKVRF